VSFPRIWVIPGNRPGDDAQVYALAEELGLPFETRKLIFNGGFWPTGNSVERKLRERTLVPPWPDVIILVGRRAVPIVRWVQRQSGGRTRLVYIGHPRVPPETFDLVFTTRQYITPSAPTVRLQPLAMSRYREPARPDEDERAWLEALPRPHHLLMLGGKTRYWRMRPRFIARIALDLARRAERAGGSLIVARSARTSEAALDRIEAELDGARCEWRVVRNEFPRFPVLLADGDALFPTADSISMTSESIIAGKPVGIVPVEMNLLGRVALGAKVDERNPMRDLRRFWTYVLDRKLAGWMHETLARESANPVTAAAREVRALIESNAGKPRD